MHPCMIGHMHFHKCTDKHTAQAGTRVGKLLYEHLVSFKHKGGMQVDELLNEHLVPF